MLLLQQNLDVQVRVAGVHPVAHQERAVPPVQNLDPYSGKLLGGRRNLHVKGLLPRGPGEAAGRRWRDTNLLF